LIGRIVERRIEVVLEERRMGIGRDDTVSDELFVSLLPDLLEANDIRLGRCDGFHDRPATFRLVRDERTGERDVECVNRDLDGLTRPSVLAAAGKGRTHGEEQQATFHLNLLGSGVSGGEYPTRRAA
jgi:hypothetical protein